MNKLFSIIIPIIIIAFGQQATDLNKMHPIDGDPHTLSMPENMPDDFNFSIQFGIGKKNEVNTFNHTVTKDLINNGTVKIDIHLTKEEMNTIYEKMKQINIVEDKLLKSAPINGIVCGKTPFVEDEWTVTINGETITQYFSDKHCELTDDANQLLELRQFILDIVKSKKEYIDLPEPEGGYF